MLTKDDAIYRAQLWNDLFVYLRAFFAERGYLEVQTPIAVASPDLSPNLTPVAVDLNVLGRGPVRAALITSPEFSMKKLLGTGLEKIFTITPVFRNLEELGATHSIEFSMLEWYQQHADYHALRDETETLVNNFLGWTGTWPRFSFVKLVAEWTGPTSDDTFNHYILPDLFTKHDKFMVMEFPVAEAALARKTPDGLAAERFEAYAFGLELCNGFTELVDATEQRSRFLIEQEERRALGKEVFPIDEPLLSALSSVASPTFGNALGLDRLLMLKAGTQSIDSIHLFPPSERFR